jgi:hypothetical protein
MGRKVVAMYDAVKKEGGMAAQMRLAMLTGVPLTQAAAAVDSAELLRSFAVAYADITKKDCPVPVK